MNNLSTSEKIALDAMKRIKTETIWGIAIKQVVAAPDPWKVRKLICDLKSQNIDCPEAMKNILGPAYDSVISL